PACLPAGLQMALCADRRHAGRLGTVPMAGLTPEPAAAELFAVPGAPEPKGPEHELVVVTPVFEDAEAAARLFQELAAMPGPRPHVVAVDDGSVRQPLDPAGIADAGLSGTVLRLRRNLGHQRAIALGLRYVADHLNVAR